MDPTSTRAEDRITNVFNPKRILYFLYRFIPTVFVIHLLFDFLFSPVWLHGYVWSLNQNYTRADYLEQSEGQLLEYQMLMFPLWMRLIVYSAGSLVILITLRSLRVETRVWSLFKFSALIGLLISLIRAQQEAQRLMPLMHLGFFAYLMVFVTGFIWTVSR